MTLSLIPWLQSTEQMEIKVLDRVRLFVSKSSFVVQKEKQVCLILLQWFSNSEQLLRGIMGLKALAQFSMGQVEQARRS